MGTRVVVPEPVKIPISNGDWILVKKRLNAGEFRKARARLFIRDPDGSFRTNPLTTETTTVLAFLVDWSLTHPDGSPLVIRDQPVGVVETALDIIDIESFNEIYLAIHTHDLAMKAERETEKKTIPTGEPASSAISSSVSGSAGGTSGWAN